MTQDDANKEAMNDAPTVLTPKEIELLDKALKFRDIGFTAWPDEKELFVKAARSYRDLFVEGDM